MDNMSADSPIHEILHIFLGSMSRFNPNLFYQLVSSVEQLPDYDYRSKFFPNRTISDIDEEIFVEELAKHLTGDSSLLDNLDKNILNKILYYI